MAKINIIFIIVVILSASGCASTRALREARESIDGLEHLNGEQETRNIELAELLKAERTGNSELRAILDGLRAENDRYFESERSRAAEKREIINRLTGIFKAESDIISKIIKINHIIREYFEAQEPME